MNAPVAPFLDGLKEAADRATAAENEFRRAIASRTAALERERAFAFRRLNLMRAIAGAITAAEDEQAALAGAKAELRARLGWSSDSDARSEVVGRFTPIVDAMLERNAAEPEGPPADVGEVLQAFENWYAQTHPVAFWSLFENVMPETPVVDF